LLREEDERGFSIAGSRAPVVKRPRRDVLTGTQKEEKFSEILSVEATTRQRKSLEAGAENALLVTEKTK